jgi:hypothetical protein
MKEQIYGPTRAELEFAGGMTLRHWCQVVGISQRTALNYRKAGKLKVVWRFGDF